ncbi:UNVERIFIED_CONTAM: Endothelin-converting enzyme-like protein [Trichonephila clavipes]
MCPPRHPDEFIKNIAFNETDYFQNLMNLAHYERVKNMKKLDIPTNRTEWIYAPTELNAYYILTSNQIVLAAAILQPPFYDVSLPKNEIILWCVES